MRLGHQSGRRSLVSIIVLLMVSVMGMILYACEKIEHTNPNDPLFVVDPPTNLTATPISDTELRLTWTDNTDFELGFKIERDSGTGFMEIGTVASNVTEYTDTGVTFGQSYDYRVAAYTGLHSSDYSNSASGIWTVTDIDGYVYQAVQIGEQVWMAENLKVTRYRNGAEIPLLTGNDAWTSTGSGAMCYYGNDEGNAATYGALYNWYAVNDSRNIAPEGWHVPTDAEWKELETALGMSQSEADGTWYRGTNEGSQLAGNADLWNSGNLVNNAEFGSSGFTALPGGYRNGSNGYYYYMGYYGYFWSATEYNSTNAWYRSLNCTYSEVYRFDDYKSYGFSVRCVKD